jgi:anti-sigma B factor antagonist
MNNEATESEFSVTVTKGSPASTVRINGEVDIHTCPKLTNQLNTLISEGHHVLILNLENVHYIDSTGLGTIAHAARNIEPNNGKMLLVSTKPQIKKLFEMSGLKDKNISLFENESTANESLS